MKKHFDLRQMTKIYLGKISKYSGGKNKECSHLEKAGHLNDGEKKTKPEWFQIYLGGVRENKELEHWLIVLNSNESECGFIILIYYTR